MNGKHEWQRMANMNDKDIMAVCYCFRQATLRFSMQNIKLFHKILPLDNYKFVTATLRTLTL